MTEHPPFSNHFQSVLSRIVTQLKVPGVFTHQPAVTSADFYDKPYSNCRECNTSRFKCKQCIGQLVVKLKQAKKNEEQLIIKKKAEYSRKKAQAKLKQSNREIQSEQQPSQEISNHRSTLTQLRKVSYPTLHQNILQLPIVVPQKQACSPLNMVVLENCRFKSLSNLTTHKADEMEDRPNNRLSVQILQIPIERQSATALKLNNPPRNSKIRGVSLTFRRRPNQDEQSLLPVIRQLNIQDREKQTVKKERMTLFRPSRPERKNNFGSLPFTAWEQNDKMIEESDIFHT